MRPDSNYRITLFLSLLVAVFAFSKASAQTPVGVWQSPPAAACAGQETVFTLTYTAAENITAVTSQTVVGANILSSPLLDKTNRTITMRVRWTSREDVGSVELNMERTVGSTITPSTSPKAVVGLRNFYTRQPLPINSTSVINLPLCSGGQPITLTVPSETYTGIPSETIADYIWTLPSTWNPQGGTVLNAIQPPAGYVFYLAGRSITVTPPVGEGDRNVAAQFYSRSCNENFPFNTSYSLISFQTVLSFLRTPTLNASGFPGEVRCGDRTVIVPVPSSSNTGGAIASYSYSVVSGAGWVVAYNTRTARYLISPSGTNGAVIRVTANYQCSVGGPVVTSVTRDFTVGFNPTPLAPGFKVNSDAFSFCPGETKRYGATEVAGATQYDWSVAAPLTAVQAQPGSRFIAITAPNIQGLVNTSVTVTAVVPGCSSVSATKDVQIGYGNARISAAPYDVKVGSFNYVCADNLVTLRLEEDATVRASTDFTWASNWAPPTGTPVFKSGQGTGVVEVYTPPASYNWNVTVSYNDGCGARRSQIYYAFPSNAPGGFACPAIVLPRPAGVVPRPVVYPNPASASLTVEHLRGAFTLYNAQGVPVQKGSVSSPNATTHLSVQALANGLYYVVGQDANGQVVRQAVQIQH